MITLLKIALISLILTGICALAASADWPSTVDVGGFSVTDIKGATNADGSGTATGRVQMPGGGSCSIDLKQTASGLITGSGRGSFTIGGVRIDGNSIILDRRGMQATGVIHTRGKAISDADFGVDPRSGVSGNGRVHLGSGFSISCSFEVRDGGVSASGSAARQASADTPLAVYAFSGTVELSGSGADLKALAKGSVERQGKIGGSVNKFGPLSGDVDIASGEAKLNVGGANVSINLW